MIVRLLYGIGQMSTELALNHRACLLARFARIAMQHGFSQAALSARGGGFEGKSVDDRGRHRGGTPPGDALAACRCAWQIAGTLLGESEPARTRLPRAGEGAALKMERWGRPQGQASCKRGRPHHTEVIEFELQVGASYKSSQQAGQAPRSAFSA